MASSQNSSLVSGLSVRKVKFMPKNPALRCRASGKLGLVIRRARTPSVARR
ncbi:hypothetical protein [Streptomyces sp. NPDC046759]|uniref:hypothetical protein n=1 Tax=Streptomyces sp. NPDC046759 TaxID=3155019 RepID=UPI0033CD8C87